jgi:hypothetical protein
MGKHGDGARRRKFLTFRQLSERWGNCSLMTLENRLRKDPRFPKVYKLGRLRMVDEEHVETYERASVVMRKMDKSTEAQ